MRCRAAGYSHLQQHPKGASTPQGHGRYMVTRTAAQTQTSVSHPCTGCCCCGVAVAIGVGVRAAMAGGWGSTNGRLLADATNDFWGVSGISGVAERAPKRRYGFLSSAAAAAAACTSKVAKLYCGSSGALRASPARDKALIDNFSVV